MVEKALLKFSAFNAKKVNPERKARETRGESRLSLHRCARPIAKVNIVHGRYAPVTSKRLKLHRQGAPTKCGTACFVHYLIMVFL